MDLGDQRDHWRKRQFLVRKSRMQRTRQLMSLFQVSTAIHAVALFFFWVLLPIFCFVCGYVIVAFLTMIALSSPARLDGNNVLRKCLLTRAIYCGTVIAINMEAVMANILNADKQTTIIGALAEGSSIRSIERQTGVHRDTIMRLGIRVGQGCASLLDSKMRDLTC